MVNNLMLNIFLNHKGTTTQSYAALWFYLMLNKEQIVQVSDTPNAG